MIITRYSRRRLILSANGGPQSGHLTCKTLFNIKNAPICLSINYLIECPLRFLLQCHTLLRHRCRPCCLHGDDRGAVTVVGKFLELFLLFCARDLSLRHTFNILFFSKHEVHKRPKGNPSTTSPRPCVYQESLVIYFEIS